jgi:hypothetical protein
MKNYRGMLALLVVASLASHASAAKHKYKLGEKIILWANKGKQHKSYALVPTPPVSAHRWGKALRAHEECALPPFCAPNQLTALYFVLLLQWDLSPAQQKHTNTLIFRSASLKPKIISH